MHIEKVRTYIREALECSVFISPQQPGLTFEEIREVGARLGYQPGEIGDAMTRESLRSFGRGSQLISPSQHTAINWKFFIPEEPEYRNFEAFDFVVSEFIALAKSLGAARAHIDRTTLVERACTNGLDRNDIEVAITIQLLSQYLSEKDGTLRVTHGVVGHPLPSEQVRSIGYKTRRDTRAQILPIVRDIISRRADGRPKHSEPFDAFAEQMDRLGYKVFRLWWSQTVAELRRSDAQTASVSICVLAAALVEGALTFVVKHARSLQLGPFRSSDFDRDPKYWRIDDLISSAATGGEAGILDSAIRVRADALIRSRQRIHAGRMLSDYPAGVPDLRPEEARDAKQTAELVVRRVLDWLEKYPPS